MAVTDYPESCANCRHWSRHDALTQPSTGNPRGDCGVRGHPTVSDYSCDYFEVPPPPKPAAKASKPAAKKSAKRKKAGRK